MKRAVLIILCIILLCIPAFGCATDVPDITKADVDSWIASHKDVTGAKAAAEAAQTTANNAKSSAESAATKAQSALTKTENLTAPAVSSLNFDNLTESQITTLKNKLGITTSTSTGTNAGGIQTGNVYIIYDPLVSVHLNPTYASNTGTGQTNFVFRVVNGTSSWQYIKLFFNFNGNSSVTLNSCDLQVGSYSNPLVFTYSPVVGSTNVTSFVAFPSSGGNDTQGRIQLGPGQYIDLNCWIQIHTNIGSVWTITITPNNQAM